MKKAKINEQYLPYIVITVSFYILMLFFAANFGVGTTVTDNLKIFLNVPAADYLFYISPALLCLFTIKKLDGKDKSVPIYFGIIQFMILCIFVFSMNVSADEYNFFAIGVLLISFMCINSGELFSYIVLLPGIFLGRAGIGYILAAYIPVLLILLLNTVFNQVDEPIASEKTENKKKNLKTSQLLIIAYLYIFILALIMLIAKKLLLNYGTSVKIEQLSVFIKNTIFSVIITAALLALFLLRAKPIATDNKSKAIIAAMAVYPIIAAVINIFTSLISSKHLNGFFTADIMYIVFMLQLRFTFKEKAEDLIPKKIRDNAYIPVSAIIVIMLLFIHINY